MPMRDGLYARVVVSIAHTTIYYSYIRILYIIQRPDLYYSVIALMIYNLWWYAIHQTTT